MIISTTQIAGHNVPGIPLKKELVRLLVLELIGMPKSSAVTNKILKATGNDTFDTDALAEFISKDQLLRKNILKLANSTYFGLSQKVPTVSRAILVLGFDAVRSIALSTSIMEAFDKNGIHEHIDRNRFWTHSLACAYLAKKIAAMTHLAELEAAFICGLLHDIGKFVMNFYFPDSYNRVLTRLAEGKLTSVEAEDEILGFTHAEVGTWLTQQWNFPKDVVFSIANHHGMIADDPRYKSLTATTRLANHLCSKEGVCLSSQVLIEPLENSIMEDLKLDTSDLLDLRHTLATRKEMFASFLSG